VAPRCPGPGQTSAGMSVKPAAGPLFRGMSGQAASAPVYLRAGAAAVVLAAKFQPAAQPPWPLERGKRCQEAVF